MADQLNTPAEQNSKTFLTIGEVAALYQVGESTLYRNIRLGRFPKPLRVCGQNRWHVDQLPKHEADAA